MPSRSDTEYVGRGVGGFASSYVYVNAVTGQQFLSTTPPTAAQQASFAQRNPGAPLPTPAPASVDSADAELREDEYVRALPPNMYVYVDAATGREYISGVPPTAAQQASFAQRNPGVDPLAGGLVQVSTPGLSVASAGAIASTADTARDQGAASQNPSAAAEQTDATGAVVPQTGVPATTNASVAGVNEDSDDQSSDTELMAPLKLGQPTTPGGVFGNPPDAQAVDPDGDDDNDDDSEPPGPGSALIEQFDTSAAAQSYIYRAVKVTHYFKGGKFTQQLNGALVIYDLPTPPNDED